MGFPGGSMVNNSVAIVRPMSSIPGLGRYPGVGNGNPLQYSCLKNRMDRGAWWVTGQKVTKSQIQLSDRAHTPDIPIGTEIL